MAHIFCTACGVTFSDRAKADWPPAAFAAFWIAVCVIRTSKLQLQPKVNPWTHLSTTQIRNYIYNRCLYDSAMKNIGERIAQKREAAGLSQSELARRLGLSPQAVQKWEAGVSTPRNSKLGDLAMVLGTSMGYLIDGGPGEAGRALPDSNASSLKPISGWDEKTPLDDDEVEVPFLREVELAAGSGRFVIQEDEGESLRFRKKNLRENSVQFNQAKCVTVRGNSMTPVLRDGATVGIDLGKTSLGDIIDGDLYAINHNGQMRVKQVFRLPSGIRLRSFNREDHPDEDYSFQQMQDEQIGILGHVFWWGMYAR